MVLVVVFVLDPLANVPNLLVDSVACVPRTAELVRLSICIVPSVSLQVIPFIVIGVELPRHVVKFVSFVPVQVEDISDISAMSAFLTHSVVKLLLVRYSDLL